MTPLASLPLPQRILTHLATQGITTLAHLTGPLDDLWLFQVAKERAHRALLAAGLREWGLVESYEVVVDELIRLDRLRRVKPVQGELFDKGEAA